MIPRYQRILFCVFLAAAVLMGFVLAHLRNAAQERLVADMADAPLVLATQAPQETVKLAVASDADDSLHTVEQRIALPASANARARAILQALFAEYSNPLSQHRLPSGNSIEDVFLLPIDMPTLPAIGANGPIKPQIAVVNLDHSFAETHPQGMATEMLTVRSMVATLHANLPQIAAVRFLVEGQPAETLAGHADLLHIYSATEEKEIAQDKDAF
jgi:hypothetical protein